MSEARGMAEAGGPSCADGEPAVFVWLESPVASFLELLNVKRWMGIDDCIVYVVVSKM